MRRKLIALSLFVPVVLLLAATAGLVWLFETEAGLHWAYAQLRARVPGTLEIQTLAGKLAGPIRVQSLSYQDGFGSVRIDTARLDWSPGALLLGRLQIDTFAADGIDVSINESANPRPAPSSGFALPLSVRVADTRLDRLRIVRVGQEPIGVRTVELAGAIGKQVARVDHLRIDAEHFGITAQGAIGVTGGADETLRVEWHIAPPGQPSVKGSGDVAGNLSRLTLTQQITAPIDVTVHAEIRQPLADLRWRVNVRAPDFDPTRLGLTGPVTRIQVAFDASGGRSRFEASGTVGTQGRDLPTLAGKFALHGATSGDEVMVDKLTLHVPDTDMQLRAQGSWRPREATWKATANWQRLRWPLTGSALLESPQGTIDANGTYRDYRMRAEFATVASDYPRAHWRITGNGDRHGIVLDDVTADAGTTKLQGKANVTWTPALRWNTTIAARGIDPAVRWREWPGSLALSAKASGTRREQRVEVQALRGTLRGQPFDAKATLVRRGADYPWVALTITAGNANVAVNGSVDARWDLTWKLAATDLGSLIPGSAGQVDSHGHITGARARPQIDAQLSGKDFVYQDTRIHDAKLNATVYLSDADRSHADLIASDGTLFGHAFEHIGIDLNGFRTDHTLDVDARLPGVTLHTTLHGEYAGATWRGSIRQSTMRVGGETWALDGTPKLALSTQHIELEQSCWRASSARACIALQRTAGAATTLSATAQHLPLATFSPLLVNPPEWRGTLDANATFRFDGGHLTSANAQVDFSPGDIIFTGVSRVRFGYDSARGRLVVDDQGLRANAEIALPGGDGGRAELALPQFHTDTDIKKQPVSGRLDFTMRNISPLAGLLPQLEALSGSLTMKFTLAGTPADPRVRGEAALTKVAARIPATGVRVHDVRFAVTANGGDELRLSGEARSGAGPGRLDLTGQVTFPDDGAWRADLHIGGDRFYIVDLRKTQVYVSPDLQAKLSPGAISVTGDVRLPQASFALQSRKQNVVSTSPDVVVVNAPEGAAPQKSLWKVTAQIHVILGDTVTFSGFGLDAKIAGDVTLNEAPGQATTARGEVRVVKGQYDAYGQKLDIERGRLVFVGGPVNNPGIDARAVRKIDIDQVTAGVEVKGTLQAPELTLFSDPAMGQSDALSYLLFGRPLEGASAEQGRSLATAARALKLAGGEQLARRIGSRFGIEDINIETGGTNEAAALVLGKQLSPRLYVNYSIGLFAPTNALHLKYKLGKHWSLEAQSGTQAGGDLIYTIER